jgi:hypothetical protein
MIATMEALGVARTRLTVGGQMRHTFLSSGWGERVHARGFARDLERALDRAMAIE